MGFSLLRNILFFFESKVLRNSLKERKAIRDLRINIKQCPNIVDNYSKAEIEWNQNKIKLRNHILEKDPRKFLQWGFIKSSMFCNVYSEELSFLKTTKDWKSRWSKAIIETKIGKPNLCIEYPKSSGNLIHHAYHLAKFEEKYDVDVTNYQYIVEYGGGYGSMCRLFYNLGYKGKYIIFDLPEFSALQVYYLSGIGLKICTSISEFMETDYSIICLNKIEQLEEILTNDIKDESYSFLATWSISETSLQTRNIILPLISNANSYLIAYQNIFGEVDNRIFFDEWTSTMKKINWVNWSIDHIPGNHYLIGRKR